MSADRESSAPHKTKKEHRSHTVVSTKRFFSAGVSVVVTALFLLPACDHGFPELETCGNGKREPGEVCDDGNNLNGDGCSADCRSDERCQNGILDPGEQCDDGNGDNTDDCLDTCESAQCGDGYVWQGHEGCDDGNTEGGDGCSATCEPEPVECGDGRIEGDEACDDGNSDGGDGCDEGCFVEDGWQCSGQPSVCTGICGDGLVVGNEVCDDGNSDGGDGCDEGCLVEDGWQCSGQPSMCAAICGDGLTRGDEDCDDGADGDPCDGCLDDCTSHTEFCGDGYICDDEQCDDANTQSGDGCSTGCVITSNWACTGEPSVCVGLDLQWTTVFGGAFDMGSPTTEQGRDTDEAQHSVTLTWDYEISVFEVTQAQFEVQMGYNPASFAGCGDNCPVEWISWHEAAAFCNVLSGEAGYAECYSCSGSPPDVSCAFDATAFDTPYDCLGYRLPTEAEWEYAARAGTTTATHNGDLDANHLECEQPNPVLDAIAWFCGNSAGASEPQITHAVGGKEPNAWGLYDVLGNVWEWCHDGYGEYPSGSATDPWGVPSAGERVLRGGSYRFEAAGLRAANRHAISKTNRSISLGFRPVRTLP